MTTLEKGPDGYTAIEVQVSRSQDYQSASTRLRYEFGTPTPATDLLIVEAEVASLADELCRKQLDQVLAEKQAGVQRAVEQQQRSVAAAAPPVVAAPAPVAQAAPAATQSIQWEQASKPYNKGTFRYIPSSVLPTDSLKAMVSEAVRAAGADPTKHVVYDERIGQYGIESGGKRASFASVKPTEDNPAFPFMQGEARGKPFTKASFYVDFNADGTVRVKATDDYVEACRQATAVPVAAAPAAASSELPF